MADFTFEVDTSPMAKSVDTVRGHVNGVTAAVTTMEAAVIATERKAAETICSNVDNGFYVMIKSQISQKAVVAYTEMTTKQMTLLQLVKALENVKRQMEADYNMICKRYTKLFQSLNKALETRVRELDRPAMKLAEIRKNIVFDKLKDESSLLLSSSGEVMQVEQTALSGKLKQKTKDTLWVLSSSANEKNYFNERVESILLPENSVSTDNNQTQGDENKHHYIPAVFFASMSVINADETRETVYVPQRDDWFNAASIVSEINIKANSFSWLPVSSGEMAIVRQEFSAICEKETSGERLNVEIMRLFDSSQWEETGK
jgi:hypothetical protein